MSADSPLTGKQLRFVAEYVAEPNGTRAYKRAYKEKSSNVAAVEAHHLLRNPKIVAEIAASRREWSRRCRVDFQRVIRRLAIIAFADPDDLYEGDEANGGLPKPRPWDDIDPGARKNIQSVKLRRRRLKGVADEIYDLEEMEYRTLDPMTALLKLCDYLGVTKGSLTADDLRSIIAGTYAAGAPQGDGADRPAGGEGIAPAAGDKPARPAVEQPKLHPDE